jgi:hypothetical protein
MQTVQVTPFLPIGSLTVTVSCTQTNTSQAVTFPNSSNPEQPNTLRVVNTGPNTVWILAGVGATVASASASVGDLPVPAGNTEVFWVPKGADHIGLICATGQTATVFLTPGQGS